MIDAVGAVGRIGRWGGPVLALLVFLLLPDAQYDAVGVVVSGLSPEGRATAAVALLMVIWWLTQAIELPVTALLPIALFPILGATTIQAAAAPYADRVIFLFLGGFLLALAIERWGLHRRIALLTLLLVGTRPRMVIAGFMLATATISMWVSNTATAAMMMPIGISVIHLVHARLEGAAGSDPAAGRGPQGGNFAVCLMLGIAYAASIGGIGTLIGTPPNVLLKGYLERVHEVEISFIAWMTFGVPLVAVFLPVAWLYLTRVAFPIGVTDIPGGKGLVRGELADLGPMQRGEWSVLVVFVLTALAWVSRPFLSGLPVLDGRLAGLTDEGIAMVAAVALFLIPVDPARRIFVMDWATTQRLPWGILLLFGGGLSLAAAVQSTGVDAWIGRGFHFLEDVPLPVLVLAVAVLVIYLTELTSNTAVTTTMLVVLGGVAVGLGVPAEPLLITAAIAASCAFMLPVATPPNAIVFGSGYVGLPQMVKAGFLLNIIGAVLVSAFVLALAGPLLGLSL